MKIKNIIGNINEDLNKAYNTIRECLAKDDGNIYNDTNILMSINNAPIVAYINKSNVIHLMFLKEKEEWIFKYGTKANNYKRELKFKDPLCVNIKMLMNSCYNFQAMMDNNYENIDL